MSDHSDSSGGQPEPGAWTGFVPDPPTGPTDPEPRAPSWEPVHAPLEHSALDAVVARISATPAARRDVPASPHPGDGSAEDDDLLRTMLDDAPDAPPSSFDLDDLASAVDDLGLLDDPAPPTSASGRPSDRGWLVDHDGDRPGATPPPPTTTTPRPGQPTAALATETGSVRTLTPPTAIANATVADQHDAEVAATLLADVTTTTTSTAAPAEVEAEPAAGPVADWRVDSDDEPPTFDTASLLEESATTASPAARAREDRPTMADAPVHLELAQDDVRMPATRPEGYVDLFNDDVVDDGEVAPSRFYAAPREPADLPPPPPVHAAPVPAPVDGAAAAEEEDLLAAIMSSNEPAADHFLRGTDREDSRSDLLSPPTPMTEPSGTAALAGFDAFDDLTDLTWHPDEDLAPLAPPADRDTDATGLPSRPAAMDAATRDAYDDLGDDLAPVEHHGVTAFDASALDDADYDLVKEPTPATRGEPPVDATPGHLADRLAASGQTDAPVLDQRAFTARGNGGGSRRRRGLLGRLRG